MKIKCARQQWQLNKAFFSYGNQGYEITGEQSRALFSLPTAVTIDEAHDIAAAAFKRLTGGYDMQATEVSATAERIAFFGVGFFVEWLAVNAPVKTDEKSS